MSPPMTARLAGLSDLLAKANALPWEYRPYEHDDWGFIRGPEVKTLIGLCKPIVAVAREGWPSADHDEHRRNKTDPHGPNAELIVAAVNALPDLLARIAALESVSLASMPFRVEAVAHLEAQERYREHRHGEPDTTEKMLRAALNVIRDMDNAARAALTLKENEDV